MKKENLAYVQSMREKLAGIQSPELNPPKASPAAPMVSRADGESPEGNLWGSFLLNTARYATVREKGAAVWLPEEVKCRLEELRAVSRAKLPIRSMAAAIITTFLDEYEEEIKKI